MLVDSVIRDAVANHLNRLDDDDNDLIELDLAMIFCRDLEPELAGCLLILLLTRKLPDGSARCLAALKHVAAEMDLELPIEDVSRKGAKRKPRRKENQNKNC